MTPPGLGKDQSICIAVLFDEVRVSVGMSTEYRERRVEEWRDIERERPK